MAIPMSTSIQNSVNTILSSTTVDGNTCCLDSEMVSEQRFSQCGQYLILHLSRFASIDGVPIKDTRRVDACADKLVVPVAVDDEVFLPCHYKLLSVINHSGTLNRGHYTAYVREPSGCWWFCNDKAVIPASVQNLSNSDLYLFFYGRVANWVATPIQWHFGSGLFWTRWTGWCNAIPFVSGFHHWKPTLHETWAGTREVSWCFCLVRGSLLSGAVLGWS